MIQIALVISCYSCAVEAQTKKEVNPKIWVREGYELKIVQSDIQQPRFMQLDDKGTLYVSLPEKGTIKACVDKDKDGYYETVTDFVTGHPKVHGMQWSNGWLWFSLVPQPKRYRPTFSVRAIIHTDWHLANSSDRNVTDLLGIAILEPLVSQRDRVRRA